MCKVYTGYCGASEIEHGLCACTVDNPLAKARGLSLRKGAQTMLYLPLVLYNQQFKFKSLTENSNVFSQLSLTEWTVMCKGLSEFSVEQETRGCIALIFYTFTFAVCIIM